MIGQNKILNVYKPSGVSPLGAIKLFQEKYSEYAGIPITYAGRLDPMAEGVLILLAGEAVHEKNNYLKLDKEYIAEILFGFETDTYDILGISMSRSGLDIGHQLLMTAVKKFRGEISLPLPPYSSYKIKGKPLFQWARENKLSEIKIPERKTKIYDIELLDFYKIGNDELKKIITEKINLIKGDFRQKEILKNWRKIFTLPFASDRIYTVSKIRIACSSGTYIRAIAHELGKKLNTGAILLSLTRTKAGEFEIKDSVRIQTSNVKVSP